MSHRNISTKSTQIPLFFWDCKEASIARKLFSNVQTTRDFIELYGERTAKLMSLEGDVAEMTQVGTQQRDSVIAAIGDVHPSADVYSQTALSAQLTRRFSFTPAVQVENFSRIRVRNAN